MTPSCAKTESGAARNTRSAKRRLISRWAQALFIRRARENEARYQVVLSEITKWPWPRCFNQSLGPATDFVSSPAVERDVCVGNERNKVGDLQAPSIGDMALRR